MNVYPLSLLSLEFSPNHIQTSTNEIKSKNHSWLICEVRDSKIYTSPWVPKYKIVLNLKLYILCEYPLYTLKPT